jgi:hypothetical protein
LPASEAGRQLNARRSADERVPKRTDYQKQFPTWGDLAREQVRRRGVPYFADVQADIQSRLERLPGEVRRAFALACAERLMRQHQSLPKPRPFTLGWRPVLDAMWLGLQGTPATRDRVEEALRAFHASPFDHDLGQDGPDDADDDAAAASIYAAECFVSGDARFAGLCAARAVESAFLVAGDELALDPNEFEWDPDAEPMPLAREAMHPAVQGELRRQLSDLESLECEGLTAGVLGSLKQ